MLVNDARTFVASLPISVLLSCGTSHFLTCNNVEQQQICFLYCCTVHFEDSLSITHQQMHKLYNIFIYMFNLYIFIDVIFISDVAAHR